MFVASEKCMYDLVANKLKNMILIKEHIPSGTRTISTSRHNEKYSSADHHHQQSHRKVAGGRSR